LALNDSPLRALADDGIQSADQLLGLAEHCWALTVESGDGRYCVLARALFNLADWWEAEVAFQPATATEIDLVIQQDLPPILHAAGAAVAAQKAEGFRESLAALLNQRHR
jgi:hypothetical protein